MDFLDLLKIVVYGMAIPCYYNLGCLSSHSTALAISGHTNTPISYQFDLKFDLDPEYDDSKPKRH